MLIPKLKDCVIGDVHFTFYQNGELWYQCDNGFNFRVPISDTEGGKFLAHDKALMFMRYIRAEIKYMTPIIDDLLKSIENDERDGN